MLISWLIIIILFPFVNDCFGLGPRTIFGLWDVKGNLPEKAWNRFLSLTIRERLEKPMSPSSFLLNFRHYCAVLWWWQPYCNHEGKAEKMTGKPCTVMTVFTCWICSIWNHLSLDVLLHEKQKCLLSHFYTFVGFECYTMLYIL